MSMKKTILPEDWEIIEKSPAITPDSSLSRVFDLIQRNRQERKIEGLNRSWFMSFMRSICRCKDGKMEGFKKPKVKETSVMNEEPEVKETSVMNEEPEVKETSVTENESMTELLSIQTLIALKIGYELEAKSLYNLVKDGYSKTKLEGVIKECFDLGILKKKEGKKSFFPISWESVRADFPDVANPATEAEKALLKMGRKRKTEHKETSVKENPPKKPVSIESRMLDWLSEEDHPANEITLSEVVTQLRIYGDPDPYQNGKNTVEKWIQEGRIKKVWGALSYAILNPEGMGNIKNLVEEKVSATDALKRSLGLMPPPPKPQSPKPQQQQKQELRIQNGILVLRLKNKDFEIINNSSNSMVSLTIENDKVILKIS